MNNLYTPWRTFSIFISSTFLDMQSERDHLKNIVFPKVEEELNKKRIRLEIVDLRWGVNTDDIADEGEREKEVLKVVLDEIKRCRPFFIGLLGDRYGWVPPEERINAVIEKEGVSLPRKYKSVTALEIEFGVLAINEQLDQSVFYFREPLDYTQMSAKKAAQYCDTYDLELSADVKAIRKIALDGLKSTISDHFKKQNQTEKVKSYLAGWDPDKEKVTELKSWGETVERDILKECEKHAKDTWDQVPQNWIEQEEVLLDAFVERHTHETVKEVDGKTEIIPSFCGRAKLLSELKLHLLAQKSSPWGLVLTGESGSGKSAVFSMLFKMMKKENCLVLAHSAGLSVKAKSVKFLLEIWNHQLADFLEMKEVSDVLTDNSLDQLMRFLDKSGEKPANEIERLQVKFRERLFNAAEKKRVILLIDALESFESTPRAQYLSWLPDVMPTNIRMICTAITGTEIKAIEYNKGILPKRIDHFSAIEASLMLEALCREAHKKLPAHVKKVILEKTIDKDWLACSSPLWLSLTVNIIMALDQDDFEKIYQNNSKGKEAISTYMEEIAGKLPDQPGPLFIELIKKAESAFGHELTAAVFNFMACSRHGLREKDLAVLLPDMGISWDPMIFANIRRWFRFQFVLYGEDKQWDLVNCVLREALLGHASIQQKRDIHIMTAKHLLRLEIDPLKTTEVMYHLLQAGMNQEAATYYGSENKEESIESTKALAEFILNEQEGIDIVSSLPGMTIVNDQLFSKISNKYIFNLNRHLEIENYFQQRLTLLLDLKDKIENKHGNKLLSPFLKANYIILLAKVGDIFQEIGQFDKAIQYYQNQFQLTNELYYTHPKNEIHKYLLAISYEKLGDFFFEIGKYDEALENFHKQYLLGKELYYAYVGNPEVKFVLPISCSKLGDIHITMKMFDLALKYYLKDLRLTNKIYFDNPENQDLKYCLAISYERVGNSYFEMRQFDKALNYFQNLGLLIKQIYSINPGSQMVKYELSVYFSKLGDINLAIGKFGETIENYQKQFFLAKELFDANPKSDKLKNGVAISYSKLGDIYHKMGKFGEALDNYQKQFLLAKELFDANPKSNKLKNGVAISYSKLGDIYHKMGKFGEALDNYQKQFLLAKELFDANPNTQWFKYNLVDSYSKLGRAFLSINQLDLAVEYFQRDLKLTKEIYETNPKNVNFKSDLEDSYSRVISLMNHCCKLGDIHKGIGEFDPALRYYQMQSLLARDLYNLDLKNEDFIKALAVSCENLGNTFEAVGLISRELECFQECMQLTKEIYQTNPKNEDNKKCLTITYSRLGEIYQTLSQFDKALEFIQKDLQMAKELFDANPKNEELKNGLAISYLRLGEIFQVMGQFNKALQNVQESLKITQDMVNASSHNEDLKNRLSSSYSRLGLIYQELGQFDKALEFIQKDLQIAMDFYYANPKNEEIKDNLAITFQNLCAVYQKMGKFKQALKFAHKALQIAKELFDANPKNEELKIGLAVSYFEIGKINQSLGQFKQALKYFQELSLLAKELYDANPKNEELKIGLEVAYSKLGEIYKSLGKFHHTLEYFQKLTRSLYNFCRKLAK